MACPITIEIGIKDNSKIIILFSKFLIIKITNSQIILFDLCTVSISSFMTSTLKIVLKSGLTPSIINILLISLYLSNLYIS